MVDVPHLDDMPRMEVTDEKVTEIEAKLAAISSDEPYVAPEPVEESAPESVEQTDPTQAEAAVEDKPDAPGSDPEPADEVSDAPTLPDNIRRSLIATGWTEDEITEQHAALGEDFETIAGKVHQKRQDESREWAARGRAVQDTEPKKDDTESSDTLARIDVENLKEKYGHDPAMAEIIDEMSKPLNASIEAINQILPSLAEQQAQQAESTQVSLRQEIDSFFDSTGLKRYEGFYGTGVTDSMPGTPEFDNRMKVLEYADSLRVGASYQGRTLGLTDALDLAHDAVSGEWQMQALREELKTKMQKRSASVTLKPAESGGTPGGGDGPREPVTRAQMEANAIIALKKVFG